MEADSKALQATLDDRPARAGMLQAHDTLLRVSPALVAEEDWAHLLQHVPPPVRRAHEGRIAGYAAESCHCASGGEAERAAEPAVY